MLYEIKDAVAHPNHTVTITWADGACGVVDFTPFIERGELFAPLQEPDFVRAMGILRGGLGLTWPNEVDFSSDGLRHDAFPDDEHDEDDDDARAPASTNQSSRQPVTPR